MTIKGARAVVVGRSNVVGMPAALLLQRADATVTVVHSRTQGTKSIVAQADIVIAAVGIPEFVKGDWIKPGAAVIDVGINPVPDSTKKTGYRLVRTLQASVCMYRVLFVAVPFLKECLTGATAGQVGDVEFSEAKNVAGQITPVPGASSISRRRIALLQRHAAAVRLASCRSRPATLA